MYFKGGQKLKANVYIKMIERALKKIEMENNSLCSLIGIHKCESKSV